MKGREGQGEEKGQRKDREKTERRWRSGGKTAEKGRRNASEAREKEQREE